MFQILDVRVNPSRKTEMPWKKGDGSYLIQFLPCLKILEGKSSAEGKRGMFTGFCFQLLDHGEQAVGRKMSLSLYAYFNTFSLKNVYTIPEHCLKLVSHNLHYVSASLLARGLVGCRKALV